MNIKSAIYNENGTIDCEIDHPDHGWIPFTASPDDVEIYGREIHAALVEAGNVSAYVPPSQSEQDAIAQTELDQAKTQRKSELIQEKMALSLTAEFAEIDAAPNKAAANAVTLRG